MTDDEFDAALDAAQQTPAGAEIIERWLRAHTAEQECAAAGDEIGVRRARRQQQVEIGLLVDEIERETSQ